MKILVIHASAGAGHTKAAEALYNRLRDSSDHTISCVDALDYTNRFYKGFYQKTYTTLITKMPKVWGFFFWLLDILFLLGVVQFLRSAFNSLNAEGLNRFLKREKFDVIFSTHFFPNEVVARLKRNKIIGAQINCIITDYDVHSIWLARGIDYYAVACDYTKKKLCTFGVSYNSILVTGIPTDKKFSEYKDTNQLKEKLRIKKDVFTILVATGSFGIGPIEEIVRALDNYQVLVVCGRNKRLFRNLNKRHMPQAKVFGLVDNMHELMSVSDCMATKPGGLSISEALVSRLPLIFFNVIPGQEEHNVRVLGKYGIGVQSRGNISVIVDEIKKLSSQKDYLSKAQANIDKLASPGAVDDITKII